jgi:hypothetical protein
MNENQENKIPDLSDPKKEPLTKRIANFSAFIYLGLAIAVVITATVGIFSISYDYEENLFGIGIAKTKNIVKVNNKPLYNADKLVDGSVIKFGKSKFLFRALCNDDFKWEFNATEEN